MNADNYYLKKKIIIIFKMDVNMCASYEFPNNTNWSSMGTCSISEMNTFIPSNSEVKEVFQIKEDLLSELNNKELILEEIDEEHKKKIEDFSSQFTEYLDFYVKQQYKVLDLEKELKEYYNKIDLDVSKLTDFSRFIADINVKYSKDIDTDNINKSILKASEKIKEENKGSEIKEKYEKELSLLNFYFKNFVKKINNGNMGNTCSLCLQRNVDTYMEPCGHTGCSQCINMLKEKMGEFNCNCFICRKSVAKFNSLYFI